MIPASPARTFLNNNPYPKARALSWNNCVTAEFGRILGYVYVCIFRVNKGVSVEECYVFEPRFLSVFLSLIQSPVVVWIKAHGVLSHCQECRLVSSALVNSDWDFPVWPLHSFSRVLWLNQFMYNACTECAKWGNIKKCFHFKLFNPKWTFLHITHPQTVPIVFTSYSCCIDVLYWNFHVDGTSFECFSRGEIISEFSLQYSTKYYRG